MPFASQWRDSRGNAILYSGSEQVELVTVIFCAGQKYSQRPRILDLGGPSGLNNRSNELFIAGEVAEGKLF